MRTIFLFLCVLIFGCEKDDTPDQVNIDVGFSFYVLDSEGNDLLNPANASKLDLNPVKLFYVVGNEKIEVNNPNADHPKGFAVYPPEGTYTKYRFATGASTEEKSTITSILIQWDENNTDTFKTELSRGDKDGYIICTKIWLNEEVVWDVKTDTGERFFELVM